CRSLWHKNTGADPETTGPAPGVSTVAPQNRPWEPPPLPTAEELAKRTSPLDGRKHEDIPPELLTRIGGGDPEQAPAELVAVLDEASILDVAINPHRRVVARRGGRPAGCPPVPS